MSASSSTHSAGRSLAVLLAAGALLWTWWQIPNWYRLGAVDARQLTALVQLWQQPWLLALWVTGANAVVLYRATLPLALPSSPGSLLDTGRLLPGLVFWLCVGFHLLSLAGLVLLATGWLTLQPLWPR
ncbi:hypothetical protein [Hymenobacter swuensis]|uniref:Uncharacterized protein n=1 Tax=Hymenobacter swuensis DY53 TaxID=1227739 RepID=W8F496_9BACT|nr:hypothetical protein [Hymenobacter swuensis]AHJ98842.1 hypothetical protein Hsw_3247 [Hymenobacter swuensis DY53]